MNIDKSKRILRKVQALIENLDDQGTTSSLERDLLKSYLLDLYEAVASESGPTDTPMQQIDIPDPVMSPVVESKTSEEQTFDTPSDDPVAPEIPDEPEPFKPEQPTIEQIDHLTQTSATEEVATASDIPTTAPTTEYPSQLLALFENRSTGDLVDKLQLQPIMSIQNEMGINERILTVNELFGGDPNVFDQALQHLNGFEDFDEATQYLLSGPATNYKWTEEGRTKKAFIFIQLVRRKYL